MIPGCGVRGRSLRSGPALDPALDLLCGGLVPALLAGTALAVPAAFLGRSAVAATAVGAGLACLALSVGPLTLRATRRWSPPAVMAAALTAYGAVVVLLGVVYIALRQVAWVSTGYLAATLVAVGTAWVSGELRAAWRLRVLAFGDAEPAADTSSGGGDEASGCPGQTGSTGPG